MKNIREHVISNKIHSYRIRSLTLFAFLLAAILILSACAGSPAETNESSTDDAIEDAKVFTVAELAEFDGQAGKSAYIAVDGIVYDVTDIPQWAGGSHAGGKIIAGKDYSEEIRSISPHGTGVLSRAKKVGILAEE
jgi:predicted heme/steroid binding protein